MPRTSRSATPVHAVPGKAARFDVIHAADLSRSSHAGLRVAPEAETAAAAGYQVGLLHLAQAGPTSPIAPEVLSAVRRHGLSIVDPEAHVGTRLLVIHVSGDPDAVLARAARVRAERIVVVSSESAFAPNVRPFPGEKMDREPWPIVAGAELQEARVPRQTGLRIGFLGTQGSAPELIRAMGGVNSGSSVMVWTARGEQVMELPAGPMVLNGSRTPLQWFVQKIDALIIGDAQSSHPLLEIVVAEALAGGKIVVLPHCLKDRFGEAALYGCLEEAVAHVGDLARDRAAVARLLRRSRAFARRHHAPERYLKRLARYVPPPKRRRETAGRRATPGVPRVLFMPKGGVGIGHVARTLAVARHAGRAYAPVFATLSESAGLIGSLGFPAEYIPSADYTGQSPEDWEPWFEAEVTRLIQSYDISAVVFDGSDPSPALVDAVASYRGCKLGWIRRGMWEKGYDPSLHLSQAFDLIVEPGELAAELDDGATASRRHEAVQVAPITLLARDELLPRAEAAAVLGLDADRPAVLLQLGSGHNRDIVGTLDHVITLLGEYPELQIAVAEWANAPGTLRLWDGVKLLRGAPLCRYFNAFDFSVAAAGYNTFHEVIGFGLPTIFMANAARGMDNQQGRARFAQDRGAAIELPPEDVGDLPAILDLMMKDSFRNVMRGNCAALYAGNGAREASARIAELVN